jgi:hypothetical protein
VSGSLVERMIEWLGRRQAQAHRIEETTARAEIRLRRIEAVVAEQRRARHSPAVNIIYDRLTGTGQEAARG